MFREAAENIYCQTRQRDFDLLDDKFQSILISSYIEDYCFGTAQQVEIYKHQVEMYKHEMVAEGDLYDQLIDGILKAIKGELDFSDLGKLLVNNTTDYIQKSVKNNYDYIISHIYPEDPPKVSDYELDLKDRMLDYNCHVMRKIFEW
jgi:hypothetical protein